MKQNITDKRALVKERVELALFVIFGILPGVFWGGVAGLKIGGMFLGASASGALQMYFIASCMMLGIILGGAIYFGIAGIVKWLVNVLFSRHRHNKCAGQNVNSSCRHYGPFAHSG